MYSKKKKKVNQFHTNLSAKRWYLFSLFFFTLDQRVCAFRFKSHLLHDTRLKECCTSLSLSPSNYTTNAMPSSCPLTPVLTECRRAAPRWRSPQLQRRPRTLWAQTGWSEPSAGMKVWAGPLVLLAPGGCVGSWQPRWASACDGLGTPPDLATALLAPFLSSSPYWWHW